MLIFIGASNDCKITFDHDCGSGFCNNGDSQCRAIFETVLLTGSNNKVGTLSARIGYIDSKELPYLCCINFATEIGSETKRHPFTMKHRKTGTCLVLNFAEMC